MENIDVITRNLFNVVDTHAVVEEAVAFLKQNPQYWGRSCSGRRTTGIHMDLVLYADNNEDIPTAVPSVSVSVGNYDTTQRDIFRAQNGLSYERTYIDRIPVGE